MPCELYRFSDSSSPMHRIESGKRLLNTLTKPVLRIWFDSPAAVDSRLHLCSISDTIERTNPFLLLA